MRRWILIPDSQSSYGVGGVSTLAANNLAATLPQLPPCVFLDAYTADTTEDGRLSAASQPPNWHSANCTGSTVCLHLPASLHIFLFFFHSLASIRRLTEPSSVDLSGGSISLLAAPGDTSSTVQSSAASAAEPPKTVNAALPSGALQAKSKPRDSGRRSMRFRAR